MGTRKNSTLTIFKQQKCINDEEPQKGGEKSGKEADDEGDGI